MVVKHQDALNGAHCKLSGPGLQRTISDRRIDPAEVLADEGFGNWTISEFGEEPVDRGLRLWMWPIVPDAVAVTEVPLEPQFIGISAVVPAPAFGFSQQQRLQGGRQALTRRCRIEETSD